MLYLGTTIASWILMNISSKAIYSRLDKEGYEYIHPEKTKAEERQESAAVIFFMCLPLVNILLSGYITLRFDSAYESIKKAWLKDGIIKPKKEQTEKRQEEQQEVEMDLKSYDMNSVRKYSELSNEEKLIILEEEKRNLLKETQKTEPYNSRGAYTKK